MQRIKPNCKSVATIRNQWKLSINSLVHGCLLVSLIGCGLQSQAQQEQLGDLGYFEFREPDERMEGVIIGATRGEAEPDSVDYVRWLSNRTGAGFVTAYGFRAKRLSVAQPIVRSGAIASGEPARSRTVFPEFKDLLKRTVDGDLKFYVGIRFGRVKNAPGEIEVATNGFTFEEIEVLRESYLRIRDKLITDSRVPKIAMAIEPLDKISWRVSAVKHHGVLMIAEKGLNLSLSRILSVPANKARYRDILASWITEAANTAHDKSSGVPHVQVTLMEQGRIEWTPSRKHLTGIVVAAPHGSFDEYTAEVVRQISFQAGIAAVIAKGFTPTEGNGWRINVNRPSERRYPAGDIEIDSNRAKQVYQCFKEIVFKASQGDLEVYVDIHQNGRQEKIEVATLGISKEQAMLIKKAYQEIRDQTLKRIPNVATVELAIEPIDEVEIGAWAAKANGILALAKKSLHFELPLYDTLAKSDARAAYASILARLMSRITATFVRKYELMN
jgi:hypothetical protein